MEDSVYVQENSKVPTGCGNGYLDGERYSGHILEPVVKRTYGVRSCDR